MEDIKTSENKKQKSMDLTVGHPLKQILLFALPLDPCSNSFTVLQIP